MGKISEEIAVKELQEFVEKYNYNEKSESEIIEEYPMVLRAVKEGLLIFDDELKPIYTLKYPLILKDDDLSVKEIKFKTRIKPLELKRIAGNPQVTKNQQFFALKCLEFLTGCSIGEINEFEKYDYQVIEQISTVFL